ncbi:hypothetical protein CAPTEDRAFT_201090 [Capitella teleta]|uniref:Ig-like domain-containing protein n=1 Tax=Capitella teleta TaxID=283909 RepID=R7UEA5_CAPTE|nr:hypothetical protein CAPTEDRAFT_201090 [Capitella teleta]|eukprot:ELU04309.1 hypothetical protein CAPTEDRAFT_201090 [Capitella teleta]
MKIRCSHFSLLYTSRVNETQMQHVLLLLFVAIATLVTARDADSPESISIEYFKQEDAILECPVRNNLTFIHWVLPSNRIISAATPADDHYELLAGNFSLIITRVVEQDVGDYLCMATRNDESVYFRVRLYQYMAPAWETYKDNFTIAIICAAVFLALCILLLLFHAYCWLPKQPHVDIEPSSGQPPLDYPTKGGASTHL